MNIKSYCRGIGAGIIVAALVMGASKNTRAMSESEIKEAAKTLGMVESSTLLEIDTNKAEAVSNESTSKEDAASVGSEINNTETGNTETIITETDNTEAVSEETISSTDISDTKEDTKEETESGTEETEKLEETTASVTPQPIDPLDGEAGFTSKDDLVEVKVIKGDSSVSVSRRLFEAGLVESAVEFDRYLCSNGYDKSISVGTYEIAYGLDFDTMARIITRRN